MDTGSHCSADPELFKDQLEFAWHPDGAIDLIDESGYISPSIVAQLKHRATRELNLKGYRLIESASTPPALSIQLYLRTRREATTRTVGTDFSGPCVYPDCWRAPEGGEAIIHLQTMGFLAADVFHNGQPIWRGWVERALHPSERDHADAVLEKAIPALFKDFPPEPQQ